MKFTVVKNLNSDKLMRPLLSGLLLFLTLFLISDLIQKKYDIGLHVTAVSNTLYGNEDEFIDPISIEALLEITHTDLFFMMMILLTLGALFGRLAPSNRVSFTLFHILNISALSSIALLFIAYYSNETVIILWLITLWLWHLLALVLSLYSFYRLYS